MRCIEVKIYKPKTKTSNMRGILKAELYRKKSKGANNKLLHANNIK